MTNADYEKFVRMMMKPHGSLEEELCDWVMGLAGESGEVVDLAKKVLFHGRTVAEDRMIEEIGDVLFYVTALCHTFNITVEELMNANYKKLTARHGGESFNTERDKARGPA